MNPMFGQDLTDGQADFALFETVVLVMSSWYGLLCQRR